MAETITGQFWSFEAALLDLFAPLEETAHKPNIYISSLYTEKHYHSFRVVLGPPADGSPNYS